MISRADEEERVLERVDLLKDELVALTQDLVRIPSISGEEARVQSFLDSKLRKIGFDVQSHAKIPSRPNLVATLEGSKNKPNILFLGHVDNIPPGSQEDWSVQPYSAEIRNGRIVGRGVADMKSGLAAMIMAGKAIKESGCQRNGSYSVAAVVDEEVESEYGMKYLAEKGVLQADASIFGEPSFPDMVVALKGGVWLRITTYGRSVGSGWPGEGINAVMKMAKVLLELENLDLGGENHPLLGRPTIAPGTTVRGGEMMHSIPDRCEATVDIYTVPGQSPKDVITRVEALLARLKQSDRDLSVKVENIFETEPYTTDTNQKVYSDLQSSIATIFGKPAEPTGIPSVGDARFMRDLGIPCIVAYGPGEHGKGHVVDESVSIDTLLKVTKVYALTALRFWHHSY